MFRVTLLIACLAGTGAVAQDAQNDCAPSDSPKITEGLPRTFCNTGVVIRRGPEIAPTPSEARVQVDPQDDATRRVIRRSVSPWEDNYSSRRVETRYVPVVVKKRSSPNFSFVYRDDNVSLRIGAPPQKQRRIHRDDRPEKPLGIGLHR